MIDGVRHVWRFFVILRVCARHNALYFTDDPRVPWLIRRFIALVSNKAAKGRDGERIARALIELGPSFVKLGQSLSVRSDLIGDEVAEDLSRLQAGLEPFDPALARAQIEVEFGQKVDALFSEFSDETVSAASIAQVHKATTTDGQIVAVKILRPYILKDLQRDLDFLAWGARIAENWLPSTRRLKPRASVAELARSTLQELDMRIEAASATELAQNFEGESHFRVPTVDWTRTGQSVLTLEWIDGVLSSDIDGLRACKHDLSHVLKIAAETFFKQVFEHGYFHADLHPGNLFISDDGALRPVDFGIMGRVDLETRCVLAEMLIGFLTRDYQRVADVHFEAGFVPADQDVHAFKQACCAIGEPIHGLAMNDISIGALLGQLFQVTRQFNMQTQPQLLLLQKTMVVAEGVGRRLDPSANMWIMAQPLIEDWMRQQFGPVGQINRITTRLHDHVQTLDRHLGLMKQQQMQGETPTNPSSSRWSMRWLVPFLAGCGITGLLFGGWSLWAPL